MLMNAASAPRSLPFPSMMTSLRPLARAVASLPARGVGVCMPGGRRPRVPHARPVVREFSSPGPPWGFAPGVWAPRTTNAIARASMSPLEAGLDIPKQCPGCGVSLQREDPKAAGFFVIPKALLEPKVEEVLVEEEGEEGLEEEWAEAAAGPPEGTGAESMVKIEIDSEDVGVDAFDSLVETWDDLDGLEDDEDDWGERKRKGKGDKTAGRVPSKKRGARLGDEAGDVVDMGPGIVCARCYSLNHYGKVKDEEGEASLPGFNFREQVGERIRREKGRKAVVVVVVDSGDFDGSLPREAMKQLGQENSPTMKVIIAINKLDLLPPIASLNRLTQWVRRRVKTGGVPAPDKVHLVSAFTGDGMDELCDSIESMCGAAGGDVWVIGAQNAGKSSLINSMSTVYRGKGRGPKVTEAPLPGTTIGVVRLNGVMAAKYRVYDTPGVMHGYQLTALMGMEDVKPLLTRKMLKPRTYRMQAGTSLHLGALARVDVLEIPPRASTIYVTAWCSQSIVLHYGKEGKAADLFESHAGGLLQPPSSPETVESLGRWVSKDVEVFGDSWDRSSEDIAVAGLGWVGVAVSPSALLRVWTYEGVQVTVRDALMPDFSRDIGRPGFTAPPVKAKRKKGKKGT